MADKNPFEIRLEVLQMAKDYMDAQAKINANFAAQSLDAALKAGQGLVDWKSYTPVQYSTQDLMDKAKEFYSFVNTK